jgi:hypothetical protein
LVHIEEGGVTRQRVPTIGSMGRGDRMGGEAEKLGVILGPDVLIPTHSTDIEIIYRYLHNTYTQRLFICIIIKTHTYLHRAHMHRAHNKHTRVHRDHKRERRKARDYVTCGSLLIVYIGVGAYCPPYKSHTLNNIHIYIYIYSKSIH